MDWEPRHHEIHRSTSVHVHLFQINLAVKTLVDQIRQPDAKSVAVAFRRQIAGINQRDVWRFTGLKFHASADDLGVHAGAADVLAHFVDDQELKGSDGNSGNERARQYKSFFFERDDALRDRPTH